MAKHHIITAATLGPRAGRDEYVAKCRTSGLPAVRAAGEKYAGRKGFARYCNDFAAAITKAQGGSTRVSRTTIPASPEVIESNPLAAEIAALRAQIALLETKAVAPAKPKAKPAAKSATTKENLWRPWAVRKFGIPTTVGGTFVYTSKKSRKASTHQVVRVTQDGCYTVKVG
jgi:hypothetical protein